MVAKNRADSQISQSLARKLNRMLFALKGAKGTLAIPYELLYKETITHEQAMRIRSFHTKAAEIQKVLDEQIAAVTDYYLTYGSTETKHRLTDRVTLEKRRKAGAILTDEEYERLFKYSTGRGYKKPEERPPSPLRDFLPGS